MPIEQAGDDAWLDPLRAELAKEYRTRAQIHCEATLMALAADPCSKFTKASGIDTVGHLSPN